MPCTLAVAATTHLVRQSVAQALSALGVRVHEFADLAELVLRVNDVAPHVVLVDADGMEGKWRPLAAGLRGSQRPVALVLLAARFGIDEAHEALSLGVAGMILKPFRKEEHTARLSALCLKAQGLRPRRGAPRFVLPPEAGVSLRYDTAAGPELAPVADLSLGGLGLRLPEVAPPAVLVPGTTMHGAVLTLSETEVPLAAAVVHRSGQRFGLRLLRLSEGRPAFLRAVQAAHQRAFGSGGKGSRW